MSLYDRHPLPPEVLASALQDRVHKDSGKLVKATPLTKPGRKSANVKAAEKVAAKPEPKDIYHGAAHAKMVGTPVWEQRLPLRPPAKATAR